MKYCALASTEENTEALRAEYKAGQEIGKLRLGTERLYFRSARRVFYIPYTEIYRYFRRVMLVPAKLCCGRGDLAIEHLVICDAKRELAQIELPGSHAAKVVMERLQSLAPSALSGTASQDGSGREEQSNDG